MADGVREGRLLGRICIADFYRLCPQTGCWQRFYQQAFQRQYNRAIGGRPCRQRRLQLSKNMLWRL